MRTWNFPLKLRSEMAMGGHSFSVGLHVLDDLRNELSQSLERSGAVLVEPGQR